MTAAKHHGPKRLLLILSVLFSIAILVSVLYPALSGAQSQQPAPESHTVLIGDSTLQPSSVTVVVNGTITWINTDMVPHQITATDGSWDSGRLEPNQSFTHVFNQAGTFEYSNPLNPEMRGSITIVEDVPAQPYPQPAPYPGPKPSPPPYPYPPPYPSPTGIPYPPPYPSPTGTPYPPPYPSPTGTPYPPPYPSPTGIPYPPPYPSPTGIPYPPPYPSPTTTVIVPPTSTVVPTPTVLPPGPVITELRGVAEGQTLSERVAIEAIVAGDNIERVVFVLIGPKKKRHTEQHAPYYFLGDRNGQPIGWDTRSYPNGSYTLTVIATDRDQRSDPVTVRFQVANSEEEEED